MAATRPAMTEKQWAAAIFRHRCASAAGYHENAVRGTGRYTSWQLPGTSPGISTQVKPGHMLRAAIHAFLRYQHRHAWMPGLRPA